MDPTWQDIVSFLTLFTLAIVSPGPNFILVVNRSLQKGRSAGAWTALGVAIGSGIYGLFGLLGWIVLLDSLAHFGFVIRLIGGGFLIVLGVQMLVKFFRRQQRTCLASLAHHSTGRPLTMVMTGLATNLSNPKAWAFYLSLFTVVLTPGMPLGAKVVLNLAMFCISIGWYTLVAVLISNRKIQPMFLSLQLIIQGLLGGMLIWFGLQLLWT